MTRILVTVAIGVVALSGALALVGRLAQRAPQTKGVPSTVHDAAATQPLLAGDWPNLFGPAHNSRSEESGISLAWSDEGPPVLWRRTIGTGYGGPIIIDGTVIVFHRLDEREWVECLDVACGETRWRHDDLTTFDCPVAYSDGPYATPVADDRRVYVIGATGVARCLDRRTGELRWRRELHAEFDAPPDPFGVPASPLLEGDRLIFNLGGRRNAGIVALDPETGQTVWTATDHGASYATPTPATIHGRRYVFVFTRDGLVALNPIDGGVHWSIPFHAANPEHVNAVSPIIKGDIVFVSGYSLGNLAVRVLPDGNFEELWRDKRRVLDSQYNNLTAWQGCVFGFASLDDSLRCVDLTTGELRWRLKSDLGRGATILVDGHLFATGEYGLIAALELNTTKARVESITTTPLFTNRGFTAPALAGGLLILRADTELVCVDLRPR